MVLALGLSGLVGLAPLQSEARDATSLSVQQIQKQSSRRQAVNLHRQIQKKSVSRKKMATMTKSANRMRAKFRRNNPNASEDAEWAALLAPENYCTDLVRKVCGVNKECADSGSCALTIQMLELYNGETNAADKSDIEDSCVMTLSDHTVFPACQQ